MKRTKNIFHSQSPPGLSALTSWGLWGLAISLGLVDLGWLNRLGLPHVFALHLLVMIAIANLLEQNKGRINGESDIFSIGLGGTVIALTLLRSQMPLGYHPHLSLFIFGIGLALMASGLQNIKFYKKEIIALGILAIHPIFHRLLLALNWQLLTAKSATLILNLIGIDATHQGNRVILQTGRVEVYGSCAGIDLMTLMVVIVTLLLLQFPLKKWQGFCCFLIAIALAFVINSLRVAILAILIAQNNRELFDYWHGDGGGWIFSLIAIAFWGLCCWYAFIKPSLGKVATHSTK